MGWGWSYLARPGRREMRNHEKLHQWVLPYPLDEGVSDARALAALLRTTTSTKPLWALLEMLGRRLGIAQDDQFFVFAAAYYFGWIRLDHARPLDEEMPPALARGGE